MVLRPILSIVVCTCNRYKLLKGCMESILADPSFAIVPTELLIIDNTPSPLRRQVPSASDTVRVIPWDPPGLSGSRNCGIRHSQGRIIGFVDDDARVRPDWCAAVIDAFDRHPQAVICGGRTHLQYLQLPLPPWFHPRLESMLSALDLGRTSRPLCQDEWIVGTNMALRRACFDDPAVFNERLGRQTDNLLSNDETELINRVGKDRTYYIPEMSVDHLVPIERMERAWFRERVQAQASSDLLAGFSKIDMRRARSELAAHVLAYPRGGASVESLIDRPQTFLQQLRMAYLEQLLADHGEAAQPFAVVGIREWLWHWGIQAMSLADRIGLVKLAAKAKLAWRGRKRHMKRSPSQVFRSYR